MCLWKVLKTSRLIPSTWCFRLRPSVHCHSSVGWTVQVGHPALTLHAYTQPPTHTHTVTPAHLFAFSVKLLHIKCIEQECNRMLCEALLTLRDCELHRLLKLRVIEYCTHTIKAMAQLGCMVARKLTCSQVSKIRQPCKNP